MTAEEEKERAKCSYDPGSYCSSYTRFFYKNIKTERSLRMFLVFSVLSLKIFLICSYFPNAKILSRGAFFEKFKLYSTLFFLLTSNHVNCKTILIFRGIPHPRGKALEKKGYDIFFIFYFFLTFYLIFFYFSDFFVDFFQQSVRDFI